MVRKLVPTSVKALLRYIIYQCIPEHFYSSFGRFFLDDGEKKFYNFCKKEFKTTQNKKEGFILVDVFFVHEVLISYAYFLNVLKEKTGYEIRHFIYGYGLIKPKIAAVYDSFNSHRSLRVILPRKLKAESKRIYQEITSSIKTKIDVYNIHLKELHIGIDIYESYLRDFNKPTVDLNDPRLFKLIQAAVNQFLFWDDFFANNKVAGYVTSHDVYVWMNIGCKLAYKYKVPVYLPNPRNITYATKPFSIYAHFSKYPEWFKAMPEKKQQDALTFSESRLKIKLSGALTIEMFYATSSSLSHTKTENPVLEKSNKLKVLIASHCFYDNPHAYNKLIFVDFYEWILFLGEMSNKTDYDWYLKVHPDPLPGTEEIVRGILNKYPKIKLINYKVSHHQLIEEGMNFVLTCYGTIGEEYPLMGAQVVNTTYNPRLAYDFNWHAKSVDEYEKLILNLNNLKPNIDINKIYEFYYMNHHYCWIDDLIFVSYRKLLSDFKGQDRLDGRTFEYFLNELTDSKNIAIRKNINDFIESKKTNYFEFINQKV